MVTGVGELAMSEITREPVTVTVSVLAVSVACAKAAPEIAKTLAEASANEREKCDPNIIYLPVKFIYFTIPSLLRRAGAKNPDVNLAENHYFAVIFGDIQE
jgi:hypothetical protein